MITLDNSIKQVVFDFVLYIAYSMEPWEDI